MVFDTAATPLYQFGSLDGLRVDIECGKPSDTHLEGGGCGLLRRLLVHQRSFQRRRQPLHLLRRRPVTVADDSGGGTISVASCPRLLLRLRARRDPPQLLDLLVCRYQLPHSLVFVHHTCAHQLHQVVALG